jgi:hypothetical protein
MMSQLRHLLIDKLFQICFQYITLYDIDIRLTIECFAQYQRQPRIEFYRCDMRRRPAQCLCQRSQPGTNLKNAA